MTSLMVYFVVVSIVVAVYTPKRMFEPCKYPGFPERCLCTVIETCHYNNGVVFRDSYRRVTEKNSENKVVTRTIQCNDIPEE